MKKITSWVRPKNVYHLSKEDFLKGEWIREVKLSKLTEITYSAKDEILTVKDCFVKGGIPNVGEREKK